jgi:hypothetical protein
VGELIVEFAGRVLCPATLRKRPHATTHTARTRVHV